MNTFIIGGCRSGKSARALLIARETDAERKLFIATCQPHDEEMRERIARHQRERHPSWKTLEVPLELPAALEAHNVRGHIILVDCLTLWVTNLILAEQPDTAIETQTAALLQALTGMRCPVILVSNEVGQGIVPENPLARRFRDWAGWVNQKVAARADRVIWMVAGIPVTIK